MALLEGAGFPACFALTGGLGAAPGWFVAVPVAILVLMVIRFPRLASVAEWVLMTREELALEARESANKATQRNRNTIGRCG